MSRDGRETKRERERETHRKKTKKAKVRTTPTQKKVVRERKIIEK